MSVNGITAASQTYSSMATTTATTGKKERGSKIHQSQDSAAVYQSVSSSESKSYTTDTETISRLKADAQRRTMQLRSLVEKLLLNQGSSYSIACDEDMYQLLREGKIEVDAKTAAQAKEDIAEDGYWGVEQTSDRIVSFAKALSGGDANNANEMIAAFVKGFEDATKSWGGELPDICQRTYNATMDKLNKWKMESNNSSKES